MTTLPLGLGIFLLLLGISITGLWRCLPAQQAESSVPTHISIAEEDSITLSEESSMKLPQGNLGLHTLWRPFTPKDKALVQAWQPEVSKILFELSRPDGFSYLVAEKRAPGKNGSHKNHLWEFPGGRIAPGEQVLDALLRELSEEDPSQILRQVLEGRSLEDSSSTGPTLYYRTISLRSGEHHLIFKIRIDEKDWQRLDEYGQQQKKISKEVYGFILLSERYLDTKDGATRELWTPKSRKILRALRRTD